MIGLLLTARSLRAFADGYVAVLLPAYLLALGYGTIEVGVLSTVTMLGSAAATLAVGRWGHRFELRALLIGAALLMTWTGMGFAAFSSLWPLLIVAVAGTMNPGGGDVSVFYPLEHTALAAASPAHSRTSAFAQYSFIGSAFGAAGALAVAVPDWLAAHTAMTTLGALKLMFVAYGAIGIAVQSVIIAWGVFTRYVLGSGSFWPEPISIFLAIQLTFYGAAACYRAGTHISLKMFVDLLPPFLKRWLRSRRSGKVRPHSSTRCCAKSQLKKRRSCVLTSRMPRSKISRSMRPCLRGSCVT